MNHAKLVIKLLIIEKLKILINAHAKIDIMIMDQIQNVKIAIIHGF